MLHKAGNSTERASFYCQGELTTDSYNSAWSLLDMLVACVRNIKTMWNVRSNYMERLALRAAQIVGCPGRSPTTRKRGATYPKGVQSLREDDDVAEDKTRTPGPPTVRMTCCWSCPFPGRHFLPVISRTSHISSKLRTSGQVSSTSTGNAIDVDSRRNRVNDAPATVRRVAERPSSAPLEPARSTSPTDMNVASPQRKEVPSPLSSSSQGLANRLKRNSLNPSETKEEGHHEGVLSGMEKEDWLRDAFDVNGFHDLMGQEPELRGCGQHTHCQAHIT